MNKELNIASNFCNSYAKNLSYNEASLAERDKEIAKLRAALKKAAQGFTNLVEIGALSTKNEEIALELANQYRAIAKDTK